MKSYEQLARTAFEAFVKERKRLVSHGTDHTNWEFMTETQRAPWIAVAKQLWAEMAAVH